MTGKVYVNRTLNLKRIRYIGFDMDHTLVRYNSENFERLSPEMELVIFRLVQECLTNIHRHSGSKTALIRVVRQADRIYVEIQDHGRGMSQERLAEVQAQGTGVGIRGMRERVRQVHGELTIESNGLGTRIFATLPAKTSASKEQG